MKDLFQSLPSEALRRLQDDYEIQRSIAECKMKNCEDRLKLIRSILTKRALDYPKIAAQPLKANIIGPAK